MEACIDRTESAELDEGIARLLGIGNPAGDSIRMADVHARAASELTVYGASLLDELSKLGIRIPPAVQLHSPDEGHVVALGSHPATEQITELINGNLFLLKRFKEVEVLHVLMRRVELRQAGQPMTCQHFNLGLTSIGCIAFFTEA